MIWREAGSPTRVPSFPRQSKYPARNPNEILLETFCYRPYSNMGFSFSKRFDPATDLLDLKGKVVIVTGAK